MPVIKIVPTQAKQKRKMKSIIDYVAKDNAVLFYKPGTENELSYLHPDSLADITQHQELIKQAYDKTDGKQYFHIISSFSPDDNVTESGLKRYAEKVLKDDYFNGYDTIVALHQDTDHKHLHFIINSVNTINGKKLDNRITDLYHLRKVSDIQAMLQLGVNPVEKEQKSIYNSKAYHAIRRGYESESDYESMILRVTESVISNSDIAKNQEEFVKLMKDDEIEVTWTPKRKHIVFKDLKTDTKKNKIRLTTLNKYMENEHSKETLLELFESNNQGHLKALQKWQEIQNKIKKEKELEKEIEKQKESKKSPPKMPVEGFREIRHSKPLEPILKSNDEALKEPESIKGGSTVQENNKPLEKPKKEPVKEKSETESEEKSKGKGRILSREEMLERSRRIASTVEGYNDYDNEFNL